MVDIVYDALAASVQALDTELDSLATATLGSAGAAVDNTTVGYPLCTVRWNQDHATNPSANGVWDFFLSVSHDAGTTYTDVDVVTLQPWLTLPVAANTNLQVITRGMIQIPNGHFKLVPRNRSGVTATGTANGVWLLRHGYTTI